MSEESKEASGPHPRGPFDHPRLAKLREREVEHGPGWDESVPEDGEVAERSQPVPPRSAQDVPREPLVERALRHAESTEGR